MNRRLMAIVAIAAVVAVAATLALPAGAGSASNATYFATSDCGGLLVIDAASSTGFTVRNEQPDGTYVTVGNGVVGSTGEVQVLVPHGGPTTNGQPQYVVYLRAPDGSCSKILATGAGSVEEEWWLD